MFQQKNAEWETTVRKKQERKETKEATSCSGFAEEQQQAEDLSESNGILHLLKGDYII